jgi:hypothetical protein
VKIFFQNFLNLRNTTSICHKNNISYRLRLPWHAKQLAPLILTGANQGAWSKPYFGVTDPLIAEAMALLDIILIHLYLHILVSCSAYSLGVDRKASETSVMHER